MVLAGVMFYPFAKAKSILRFYSDFSRQSPDALNTIGGLGTSHDGAKVGVMAVCYSGPLDTGEQVLRPVREFGPPVADHIQPMPYTAAQKILAPLAPAGRHYYIKSHFIQEISDGAIDTMVAHFEKVTSPLSAMIFQQLGNAVQPRTQWRHRLRPSGHRLRVGHHLGLAGPWRNPAGHIQWTRAFSQAMLPFTKGFYVNQVGTEAEEGADLIREAFGANYQRLADLKRQYDPTNLFRHNQNITADDVGGGSAVGGDPASWLSWCRGTVFPLTAPTADTLPTPCPQRSAQPAPGTRSNSWLSPETRYRGTSPPSPHPGPSPPETPGWH